MRRAGFTLVEIMVVVGILSIVAMLAIPAFHSTGDEQKVEGAAREIADALACARSEALKAGRKYRVEVDTATEEVAVYDDAADALIRRLADKQWYRVVFGSVAAFAGVDIVSVNGGSGRFAIIFDPAGRADADYTINLACQGYGLNVFVNALVGRVTTGS